MARTIKGRNADKWKTAMDAKRE